MVARVPRRLRVLRGAGRCATEAGGKRQAENHPMKGMVAAVSVGIVNGEAISIWNTLKTQPQRPT